MAKFFGKSRSQKKADNNLGVKASTLSLATNNQYRSERLHEICKYVDGTQYDHLADWDASCESDGYVPLRKRKPKIIYPFAQLLAERVGAKLLGRSTFPKLDMPEDPDTKELLDLVVKSSYIKPLLLTAVEKFITHKSVFVRFKIVQGSIKYDYYNSKYCYPEFDDAGNLTKIEIKYTYEDTEDLDSQGKPRKKWYKIELGQQVDTLYDNPYFVSDQEPVFEPVRSAKHDLGFVQGEWFRHGQSKHSPDGVGKTIVEKCMPFIDALNYNLSQMDKAVQYGQDPQLAISGMDEDEIDNLIKSSSKGWNLGREGNASFLEVGGSGVSTASEYKHEIIRHVQDVARVVMLDPEKIVGSAQSGKAMEVLHGPLVELVDEMRPHIERGIIGMMQKILASLVIMNQRGMELIYNMPPQYTPVSMDITAAWPPMFPPTTQDKQQIISMMLQLSSGNIISRETALKNLLAMIPDIEIDDLELEVQRVNTQQQFNTFGF